MMSNPSNSNTFPLRNSIGNTNDNGKNDEDDDSYGPVTRLAHRAAAQDEAARKVRHQQHLHEQRAKLQATALAVGEAAWVIAKATQQPPQHSNSSSSSLTSSPVKVATSSSSAVSCNEDVGEPTARNTSPLAAPRRRQIQRQQQHHDNANATNDEETTSDDNDEDCDIKFSFSSFEGKDNTTDHDPCCHQQQFQHSPQYHSGGGEQSNDNGRAIVYSCGISQQEQHRHPLSEAHHHRVNSKDNMSSSSSYSSGVNCVETGGGGGRGGGGGSNGGLGGGIFANAKNWLQSQRERLHQLELERQVEDQRRKLVEEGRKQRAREAEERRKRIHRSHHHQHQQHHQQQHFGSSIDNTASNDHINDNENIHNHRNTASHPQSINDHSLSTGGEITTTATSPTLFLPPILQDELCILPQFQGELCNLSLQQNKLPPPTTTASSSAPSPYTHSAPSNSSSTTRPSSFMCGFGSAYDYNPDMDEDNLVVADYPGVARVDSYGNILEMIPSGSLDDENDDVHHYHHLEHLHDESGARLGVVGKKKVYMSVSSPRWTCSGEGMSVKVDIEDFNDDSTCEGDDDNIINNNNNQSNGSPNLSESDDSTQPAQNNSDGLRVVVEVKGEEDEDDPYFVSDIKIVPETPKDEISSPSSAVPPILRPSQMKSLISSGGLPPSLTFCKWKRLYSLIRDGDSFEQFLHRVEGHDRTVLVVKTTTGCVFGGYADTRWEARHVRRHASEYYGSAQAFLFRFPNYVSSKSLSDEEKEEGENHAVEIEVGESNENDVIIYKWSGANRYIQLCDASRKTIAFGGGGEEGDFGLCIEDDFRRGTSGHCSTFENEALCEEGYFFVMDLEVWGFTLDF
ncbi:hypothetical protein ACHAXH_005682 [Discostella pseudostelligera]